MAKCRRSRKTRRRLFIRALLTPPPSSTPIGSRSIIAKPMGCMRRTASCSIMKGRRGPRPSSRAKSPARSPRSIWAFKTSSFWAILTPSATGAMPAIMSKGCGASCSSPKPDDYVLATGEAHSVREFVECAFAEVGIEIGWKGAGVEERGFDRKNGPMLDCDRSALFSSDRGRSAVGRSQQGVQEPSVGSTRPLSRSSSPTWSRATSK